MHYFVYQNVIEILQINRKIRPKEESVYQAGVTTSLHYNQIGVFIGGVQPHFCSWKNVCFPIFSRGEKWGKKYMEREGNEYFSLSFHILFFPFFPMGKMGKRTFFHGQKWGWTPLLLFNI